MKTLFLHGWQSTPGGRKPTFLASHGHEVLNPALPDDDFDAAVRIAQAEYDEGQPDVVVGSSRGGAVAMNIDSKDTPLVLLCPAWKTWGTATTAKPSTTILHSRADESVPFADSEELVRNSGLPSSALIETGHEHRLADEESLAAMVRAVQKSGTENSSVGSGSLRHVAGVPRRFSIGVLLVATMMCGVLFAVLRVFGLPPIAFFLIVLFFLAVGVGQAVLFKGQRPRKASVIVGALFLPCQLLGVTVYGVLVHGLPYSDQLFLPNLCGDMLGSIVPGAILGYFAGTLIAGIFLAIDELGSLRGDQWR